MIPPSVEGTLTGRNLSPSSLLTGELFALCPYDMSGNSVEAVLDSSRYFVLRVESQDPSTGNKKKAYIGMGVSIPREPALLARLTYRAHCCLICFLRVHSSRTVPTHSTSMSRCRTG